MRPSPLYFRHKKWSCLWLALPSHLQMKKTPPPNLHQSSQSRQNANLQFVGTNNDAKRHSSKTLRSLKYAAKKCAAVFSLFLYGKRKSASYVVGNDDRKNTSKIRGVVSCKYDGKKNLLLFWVIWNDFFFFWLMVKPLCKVGGLDHGKLL